MEVIDDVDEFLVFVAREDEVGVCVDVFEEGILIARETEKVVLFVIVDRGGLVVDAFAVNEFFGGFETFATYTIFACIEFFVDITCLVGCMPKGLCDLLMLRV